MTAPRSAESISLLGNAILQRLRRSRMSGYELKKLFTTPLGYGWRAYDTQIYRELKVLERTGLICGANEDGRGGPQRRVYDLTPAGEAALARWLERVEAVARVRAVLASPASSSEQV